MPKKEKKCYKLTHAEILCLAIKGMEPDIRHIAFLLKESEGNPDVVKMAEQGYGETMWKFGALLGLYKLETGVEHDLASEYSFPEVKDNA